MVCDPGVHHSSRRLAPPPRFGRVACERASRSDMPETGDSTSQTLRVAQAELRSLPATRKVYAKRAGVFFRADKQKVLAETLGKLKALEPKKK